MDCRAIPYTRFSKPGFIRRTTRWKSVLRSKIFGSHNMPSTVRATRPFPRLFLREIAGQSRILSNPDLLNLPFRDGAEITGLEACQLRPRYGSTLILLTSNLRVPIRTVTMH